MQATGGDNIKIKGDQLWLSFLFLLSPQAACIFRWAYLKIQAVGGDNRKEKTAKVGRLLFLYCRPQPHAFSGGTTWKCKWLEAWIKKNRQPKLVYFYFYIVALSCLHSTISPPENAIGWGWQYKNKRRPTFAVFLLSPPAACILS